MPEVIIPVEVTIDDLIPVMAGPDLVDIQVAFTIRYVDGTQTTIATRQESVSAFSYMTPEQRTFVTAMAANIKQQLHLAIVGQ